MALTEAYDEIRAAGASLVTLSPQLPRFLRAWVDEDGIPFPVVPDPGNGVARTYGLVFRLPDDLIEAYREIGIDLERYGGDESWTLPIPATFLIDPEGRVTWGGGHPDYRKRPEPRDLLARLRAR